MSEHSLPLDILRDTLWSFTGTIFDDPIVFSEEVRQYQIDISKKDTWMPDLVVLPVPRVRIAYEYWDDDGEQAVGDIELESANGKDFTALDLLFKIHNAVVDQLCDDDHHFFEGLSLETEPPREQLPRYLLNQGS